jgi:hypothetical protein
MVMRSLIVVAKAAIASWLLLDANVALAENFRRIVGPQIQARFAGMELSDDVHWRDHFGRTGTLTSQSMGGKRIGRASAAFAD